MSTNIDAGQVRGRLTDLLKDIETGESFVITKYGKPVARLTGLDPTRAENQEISRQGTRQQSVQRAKAQQAARDALLRKK